MCHHSQARPTHLLVFVEIHLWRKKEEHRQVLLFPALLSMSCTIYTQGQEQAGKMVPMTCVFRNQPNNIST